MYPLFGRLVMGRELLRQLQWPFQRLKIPRWVEWRRCQCVELWGDLFQWGEFHLVEGLPLLRALGKLVYE